MKRTTICLLLLLVSLLPAGAQVTSAGEQPATREDVVRLFEKLRLRQQCEAMQQSMISQWKPMLDEIVQKSSSQLTPEQQAKMRAMMDRTMQQATAVYPVAEILEDFIPAYQSNLTKSDIEAIVSFYSSPAGQRLLDKTPKITQDGLAAIMPKMRQKMMTVMEQMQRNVADMVQASASGEPQTKK
jgi:uncharacterized protein